jgi:hypothetical protein
VCQFASHLHCGFDVPLANGLQISVITYGGHWQGTPSLGKCARTW